MEVNKIPCHSELVSESYKYSDETISQ